MLVTVKMLVYLEGKRISYPVKYYDFNDAGV
jgi:hypothetical protein